MVNALIDPKKKEEIKKALDNGDFKRLERIGRKRKPPAEGKAPDKEFLARVLLRRRPNPDFLAMNARRGVEKLPDEVQERLDETLRGYSVDGTENEIIRLLENGADVNSRDRYGKTALIVVAERAGPPKFIEIFIKSGADVNARDDDGETALMKAASIGRKEHVLLLIKNGADLNAEDDRKRSVVQIARDSGQDKMVRLLKKHGATG